MADIDNKTPEQLADLYKKLYSRIEEIANDSARNSRSVTSVVEEIMTESKNSNKYILDELEAIVGPDSADIETFATTLVEHINKNATNLKNDLRAASESNKDKQLTELVKRVFAATNTAILENKSDKANLTSEMEVNMEHSSGDFQNITKNYFNISNNGKVEEKADKSTELEINADEIIKAIKNERESADKELEEIRKAIIAARNSGDQRKVDELKQRRSGVEKKKNNAEVFGSKMKQKVDAGEITGSAAKAIRDEDKAKTKANEDAASKKINESLTVFERIKQSSMGVSDALNATKDVAGEFNNALGVQSKEFAANTGPLGEAFSAVTTAFRSGLGPLALFTGGLALVGVALKGYHEKLNVAREMASNGYMVDKLRDMHFTTLMPPEELKKLSDSIEGSFNTSLTRNQNEMEAVAVKQRLTERVMGKEYAEQQMAAVNELKNSLSSDGASNQMEELQNATTALAKTMGVSNKYALEQIKAINQNTKEIGKNMGKGARASLQKSLTEMEAGWKAMGMGEEEIAQLRDSIKSAYSAEGASNTTSAALTMASMDPALLDQFARSTGAGSSKDVLESLNSLSLAEGDLNVAAKEMAQRQNISEADAIKKINAAVEATTLAGAARASKTTDVNELRILNRAGIYGGTVGEKAAAAGATEKRASGAATAKERAEAEAQTKHFNALLISMGANDPASRDAKILELTSKASKEDQAAIQAKLKEYTKMDGKELSDKELESMKESKPEEYAQHMADAYKAVMGDRIKKSVEGGDSSLGIDASGAKALMSDRVKYETEAGKLVSTKAEQTQDTLQKAAIAATNALESTIMKFLIPALIGLTAMLFLSMGAKGIGSILGGIKDAVGGIGKFFGGGSGSAGPGVVRKVGGAVWNGAKAVSSGIGSGLRTVGTGALNAVRAAPSAIGSAASTVGGAVKAVPSLIGRGASAVASGVSSLGQAASAGVGGLTKSLGSLVEVASKGASTLGSSVTTLARGGLTSLGSAVTSAGSGLLGGLGKAASGFLKFAGPVGVLVTAGTAIYGAVDGWGKASEYFGKKTVSFSEKMSSAIGGALETLSFGLLDGAKTAQWVEGTFGGVWDGMKKAWDGTMAFLNRAWESFNNIFAPVIEAGKKVIDDITNVFVSPFKAVWALFTGDIGGFMDNLTQMFTSWTSLFTTVPQLFSEAINSIWEWVKNLGNMFVDKFGDMFDDLLAWWEEFKIMDHLVTPIINKIQSGWDSLSNWISTIDFYDLAIRPLIDMVSEGIAGFMKGVKRKAVDLLGEKAAKLMGIVDDKDLADMKSEGQKNVASGGKTGKELFDQMASNGMGEKNWTTKDEVKKDSLSKLSDVQLKSLKDLDDLSKDSKKAIEDELAARKAGTKVQEKVTDASGKVVEAKKGSMADLMATGAVAEGARGKKTIKDTTAFEKMTKEDLRTFLSEQGGNFDKASIEKLRELRNNAKSQVEIDQLKRAEEIKNQEAPKASEEDKKRAAAVGEAVLNGVEAAKTKAGELAGQAKTALIGKDDKTGKPGDATKKPSASEASATQAKTALGVSSSGSSDAGALAAKARNMAQLDPKKLEEAALKAGAGSSGDVIKNLEKISLFKGDMNAAADDLAKDQGISKEEAMKKLTAAVNAANGVEKEALREAKKEDAKADAKEDIAALQDASGNIVPELAVALNNKEGPKDTNGLLAGILKATQDLVGKGDAVISDTVKVGKETVVSGKKAYDESRASGKGVVESIGVAAHAGLGSLSAKYESGKKGSEAVGWDSTGGTSYGKYQIASKTGTMDKFLKYAEKANPEVAARLRAAGPADGGKDGAFAKEWKKLAAEGKMGDLEHEFIQKSHYDPAMASLKGNKSLTNMINSSAALQDVMWSTSVQHGAGNAKKGSGAAGIFNKVYKEGMSEEDLIKAVYAERGTKFGRSSAGVQKSVKARFIDEEKNALAMVGKKPSSPTDVVRPTNPETGKTAKTGDTNNRISPQAADFAKPKSEGGTGLHNQKPNVPPANGKTVTQDAAKTPATGSLQGPGNAVTGAITGVTPTAVATAGGIDMYAQTQAAIDKGIKYGFGSKDLKNGSIDCSGWVASINQAMMDSVVDEMGKPVYGKEAKKLFNGPAADIIKNVTEATGGKSFEGAEEIKKNLKPGMIIGEDNGEKGWDKGRYKGIDHITQVVQDPKTGQMMISESRGGKGVTMRTVEEYFAAKKKATLTAVDPTLLAKGTPADQSTPNTTGTQVAAATKDASKTPAATSPQQTAATSTDDTTTKKINILKQAKQINIQDAERAAVGGSADLAAKHFAKAREIDGEISRLEAGRTQPASKDVIKSGEKPKDVPTAVASVAAQVAAGAATKPQQPQLSPEDQKLKDMKAQKKALEDQAYAALQSNDPAAAAKFQAQADAVSKQITDIQQAKGIGGMQAAQNLLQQQGGGIGGPVGGMLNNVMGAVGVPRGIANPLATAGNMAVTGAIAKSGLPPGLMPVVGGALGGIGNGLITALGLGGTKPHNVENIKYDDAAKKNATGEIAKQSVVKGIDDKQVSTLVKNTEEQNKKLAEQNAMVAQQPTLSDQEKLQKNANDLIIQDDSTAGDAAVAAQAQAASTVDPRAGLSEEQKKWLGGADATDPFILARMREAVPDAKPDVTSAVQKSATSLFGDTSSGVSAADAQNKELSGNQIGGKIWNKITGVWDKLADPLQVSPALNPALNGSSLPSLGSGISSMVSGLGLNATAVGLGGLGSPMSRAGGVSIPGTSGSIPTIASAIPMNATTASNIVNNSTINNMTTMASGSSGMNTVNMEKLLSQVVGALNNNGAMAKGAADRARKIAVDSNDVTRKHSISKYGGNDGAAPHIA